MYLSCTAFVRFSVNLTHIMLIFNVEADILCNLHKHHNNNKLYFFGYMTIAYSFQLILKSTVRFNQFLIHKDKKITVFQRPSKCGIC